MTHAMKSHDDCLKVYDKIHKVDLATVEPFAHGRLWRRELAKEVRAYLKTLGISSRDVSVTVPTYANASTVHIGLPDLDYYAIYGVKLYDFSAWDKVAAEDKKVAYELSRAFGELRRDAQVKLLSILRCAFPDCDDRGDSMTDYYDDPFFIWA
jgi:hypothetical protein